MRKIILLTLLSIVLGACSNKKKSEDDTITQKDAILFLLLLTTSTTACNGKEYTVSGTSSIPTFTFEGTKTLEACAEETNSNLTIKFAKAGTYRLENTAGSYTVNCGSDSRTSSITFYQFGFNPTTTVTEISTGISQVTVTADTVFTFYTSKNINSNDICKGNTARSSSLKPAILKIIPQ
ncbi:hypothetical protein [Leptospira sp. 'Mane']|uniref:hypothetical protein n=1 Tax=Leptospira sp. 'Mane' TaxID=3387407 RepID=UPI00398B39D5